MCAVMILGMLALEPADIPSLEAVITIQKEFTVLDSLLEGSAKESQTGFLISAYQLDELQRFLSNDGWGFLALSQNLPAGYVMASSGASFLNRHPNTDLTWNSSALEVRYRKDYEAGNFEYLDQIAVTEAVHRRGVADRLHEEFVRKGTKPLKLAAVLDEPIRNRASINFFESLGYEKVGSFFTAELRGVKNVKSTVYAKEIR